MPLSRRSFNLLAAAVWSIMVVTKAMTSEMFEVSQEFTAATQVDNITGFFTKGKHCSSVPSNSFTLYLLDDFSRHGNTCVNTIKDDWCALCLPLPTQVFLVHSFPYSPPLPSLTTLKTNIAALAHFLSLSQRRHHGHHKVMVLDQSLQCWRVQHDASDQLASALRAISPPESSMVTLSSNIALLTASSPLLSNSELGHDIPATAYATTKQLLETSLLEQMMTASTLQEYSKDRMLENDVSVSLGQFWQQLVSDLDGEFNTFPIFNEFNEESVSKSLKNDDASPIEQQYRTQWQQRDVFMIALGDEYYSAIDWSLLKKTLQKTNPGYVIHVYGDQEVEEFLQGHFPLFVAFYHSGHLRYHQWKSDFVRYLLLYKYGGVYIDLDHKLVMSFDKLLDSIQSSMSSVESPSFPPQHVFVKSVNPGCIHNGFIMTNTVEDELFLALAGQIFLTTEAEALDYGLNTRNLYKLLEDLYGPLSTLTTDTASVKVGLKKRRDLFLLQEVKLSSHAATLCNTTGSCKYGIKINSTLYSNDKDEESSQVTLLSTTLSSDIHHLATRRHVPSAPTAMLVMYSNGLPNWSPKLGRQVFLSS